MSLARILPRSPCIASAGWRKWLGVPVEARVALIFCAIIPDLPMPETMTLPLQLAMRSIEWSNESESWSMTLRTALASARSASMAIVRSFESELVV